MITIRRFSPEDSQTVTNLITGIMDQEFVGDKAAYPTQDIENIMQSYGGLGEAFFVASLGSKVIGTVAIKKEDDRVALMRRLFVDQAYRKQQLGQKLIERAIKFCDEVGYKEVVFRTTSRMEGANKTCQKKGFVLRAKLPMGNIELLKFSLSLRNSSKEG